MILMTIEKKYAELLVAYCLELKKGDRVYIHSTILAEPLVREVYRCAVQVGAHPEVNLEFEERNKIFMDNASDHQLDYVSPVNELIINHFDAYLYIRAPYNLKAESSIASEKRKKRSEATRKLNQVFSERTADGSMVRSLCQYPTNASAQEAGMSLEEYRDFVYKACHLFEKDPAQSWLKIRKDQQRIVDFLNNSSEIRYKGPKTDVSFSVEGRTWINSDGRVNMPSGEVFTGPVEDTVEGKVFFDYPSIYLGREVSGVAFEIEGGEIVKWSAEKGQSVLDEVMALDGARFFGEVAIGTNYNIQRATKNILFDEKIGGTIHMAVGQSYIQTGGKNQSVIHWDLISNMKDGGAIYADNKMIYQNGKFLI